MKKDEFGEYFISGSNPNPGNISQGIGAPGLIEVTPNNTYRVNVKYLANINDFMANWQSNWAGALLPHHPEYKYLYFYENNFCSGGGTDVYNATLAQITTYDDASDAANNSLNTILAGPGLGILNGEGLNLAAFNFNLSDQPAVSNPDQFVKNYLKDVLLDFQNHSEVSGSATLLSLWDYCTNVIGCGVNLTGNCNSVFSALTSVEQDQVWALFRSIYIAENKKHFNYLLISKVSVRVSIMAILAVRLKQSQVILVFIVIQSI